MRHHAGRWIDREGNDLFRVTFRDFFNFHAAFRRNDESHARGFAIDQGGQIEFAVDGGAFFDIEAIDFLAVRTGLMRDQRRTEDARRFLFDVIDRFNDLDAAGLAAATGVNLRLHDPYRTAKLVGGLDRFIDGKGRDPARHRHAKFTQDGFGLILVDIHNTL